MSKHSKCLQGKHFFFWNSRSHIQQQLYVDFYHSVLDLGNTLQVITPFLQVYKKVLYFIKEENFKSFPGKLLRG